MCRGLCVGVLAAVELYDIFHLRPQTDLSNYTPNVYSKTTPKCVPETAAHLPVGQQGVLDRKEIPAAEKKQSNVQVFDVILTKGRGFSRRGLLSTVCHSSENNCKALLMRVPRCRLLSRLLKTMTKSKRLVLQVCLLLLHGWN